MISETPLQVTIHGFTIKKSSTTTKLKLGGFHKVEYFRPLWQLFIKYFASQIYYIVSSKSYPSNEVDAIVKKMKMNLHSTPKYSASKNNIKIIYGVLFKKTLMKSRNYSENNRPDNKIFNPKLDL